MKTPYWTASFWSAGTPELSSELTAAACGPVNCTGSGPAGVGIVTVCMPKLLTPMLENPDSWRCVYSYDPKKKILSFLRGPPKVNQHSVRGYACWTASRGSVTGLNWPE